jgi:hypothetical protein
MDLSPGLQLVWLLAGRETRLSNMAEIEPEHFFCALLKFAGTSEQQITKLIHQNEKMDVLALLQEQQTLIELFVEQGIEKFSIRNEIRRAIGKGDVTEPPDTYHRSFASRRLFRRAERLASVEDGVMEAQHLLKVLLKHPPSKVKPFIDESADAGGKTSKRKKVEEEASEKELVRLLDLDAGGDGDELCPFLYNLEPGSGFKVPQRNQPQLIVLEWALQQSHPLHLLLLCEAGVPVFDITGKADQSLPDEVCIRKVELPDGGEAHEAEAVVNKLAKILGYYASEQGEVLFADLRESSPAIAAEIVTNLEGSLPQLGDWDIESPDSVPVRLILAIDAGLEKETVMDQLAISDLYRTIWLHQLDFPRHIESV